MKALLRLLRVLTTPVTCNCCKTCQLGHECPCGDCDVAFMD